MAAPMRYKRYYNIDLLGAFKGKYGSGQTRHQAGHRADRNGKGTLTLHRCHVKLKQLKNLAQKKFSALAMSDQIFLVGRCYLED